MKVKLTKANNGKSAGETVTVSDVEGTWLVANDYATPATDDKPAPTERAADDEAGTAKPKPPAKKTTPRKK